MTAKRTRKHISNQLAFTLVELLVVIAILAILGSIILAITGNARQSANKTQSISNLRQIAVAMKLYANENQGKFPPGYFYKPGEGERIWMQEIEPYIDRISDSGESSENIFVSPLANIDIEEGDLAQGVIPCTYSAHGVLCPDITNSDDRKPVSTIPNPSELIILGEASLRNNTTYAFATFLTPSAFQNRTFATNLDEPIPVERAEDDIGGGLSYRANGSTLVAYVDGHVEAKEKGTVKYRNIVIEP